MFAFRVAALAALVSAAPALAGLDGATISAEFRAPNLGTVSPSASPSVSPFVVGAGVETVFTVNDFFFVSTDFSNLGLTLTFNTGFGSGNWIEQDFNGLVFTSSAFAGLSGATVLGSTTFGDPLFDASRLTLTNSELRLNFSDIAFEDGQQIDIAFRPTGGVIPEPATWGLLITGFGLVGAAARRRRTATTHA